MKDAYSFHLDREDAEREYRNMYDTYRRIFTRCGLEFRAVEADSGAIGGSLSHEFQVLAESGEDALAACGSCDYAANVQKAESRQPAPEGGGDADAPPETVATPDLKTVPEVAAFPEGSTGAVHQDHDLPDAVRGAAGGARARRPRGQRDQGSAICSIPSRWSWRTRTRCSRRWGRRRAFWVP